MKARAWLRSLVIYLAALACAVAIAGWNASRFLGAKPEIRTKDLSFLPTPEVARLLAIGHDSTAAKLRWLDSFAYFQLQLDRRDDTVDGGFGGGFQRLYDALIELDPKFEPFYQYAAMCTGGLTGKDHLAMGYLQRGIMELPHETGIWRHIAALLVQQYRYEECHPELLDAFFAAWTDAESTFQEKQIILIWKANMAKRRYKNLEQFAYWQDRLRDATPGSTMCEFIEGVMRDQLARYGENELKALCALYQEAHGRAASGLDDVMTEPLLRARYGDRSPPWAPVMRVGNGYACRPDPYGLNYALVAGKPVSPGLTRERFRYPLADFNRNIESRAREIGYRPRSIAELTAISLIPPTPPEGGRLIMERDLVRVEYPDPSHPRLERDQLLVNILEK